MTKEKLKKHAYQEIYRLRDSVLRAIDQFPCDKNWDKRHVHIAIQKLVENPEIPVDKIIKEIKRSWVCTGENWLIDKGNEYIPLTQQEKDFNKAIKKAIENE